MKNGKLIFLFISLALILLWMSKRDKSPQKEVILSQSNKSISNAQTASLLDHSSVESSKQIEGERSRYTRMAKLGFQSIPTRNDGNKLEILIEINTPSAGCQIGEFDLIKNLSANISANDFLLTIEQNKQKAKPSFSKAFSILDVAKKNQFTVVLPQGDDEGQGYSINLCMNEDRHENCLDKRKLDPKKWQSEMNRTDAHDFLFYTQFIVLKSKAAWLVPSHRFDANSIKSLEDALKPMIKDLGSFRAFSEDLRILSPMPAQVTQSKLILNLPSRASGC